MTTSARSWQRGFSFRAYSSITAIPVLYPCACLTRRDYWFAQHGQPCSPVSLRLDWRFRRIASFGATGGRLVDLIITLVRLRLTAISVECRYAAIRERMYTSPAADEKPDIANTLVSTGTSGSKGTLGRLVEISRYLRHHLRYACELGQLCSNAPVCAAHDSSNEGRDSRLERAAWYDCFCIAGCSCERFSHHPDSVLAMPTIGNDSDLAFFQERQ